MPANAQCVQDGKRDSGHAATAASDPVIHEQECEHDLKRLQIRQCHFLEAEPEGCHKLYCVSREIVPAVELVDNRVDADRALAAVTLEQAGSAAGAPPLTPASTAADSPSTQSNNNNNNTTTTTTTNTHDTSNPLPSLKTPSFSPRRLMRKNRTRSVGLESPDSSDVSSEGASRLAATLMELPSTMRGSLSSPASSMRRQPTHSEDDVSALPSSSGPSTSGPADLPAQFAPLAVSIPSDNLLDDAFMSGFSFSKRGSIMFGGKRTMLPALDGATDLTSSSATTAPVDENGDNVETLPSPPLSPTVSKEARAERASSSTAVADAAKRTPPPRHHPSSLNMPVLSPDVEKESQKVRLLYEFGDAMNWEDGARFSFCEHLEPTPEVLAEDSHDPARVANPGSASAAPRCASSFSHYHADNARSDFQLAGGMEDWEDVDIANVDRYGFIITPRQQSTTRVNTCTELKSAQFSPRRRHVLQKRDPMGFSSGLVPGKAPSRKVSARSLNTVNSERSVASMRSSRSVIRQASNLLPHNRSRRWMDEAGDMLTISPNLQDSIEEAKVEKISEALKRKEWERSEKWHKMARVINHGEPGEGMDFEFDVKNPKLIERTWKGIPDRWRAAAWWSFLASAARDHEGSPSADKVMARFRELQGQASPDDVQIHLDVPRTISRHIMFRRRHKGGQRLLFRVLHAISIYFPETGYVQGMASLAATLLCYFDEEKAFVMLVRMWQLRGLERLYSPDSFDGLMTALREFDQSWLSKAMSEKLSQLEIDSTAYGTKWYLTLFNLSIPFPAQLRVWDVFLLLGGRDGGPAAQGAAAAAAAARATTETAASTATSNPRTAATDKEQPGEPSGLDVLHAASAALIDALRDVLVDSDFENAMKALTSWIAIKDEDLLMKVTKAEWKAHQGKKKT